MGEGALVIGESLVDVVRGSDGTTHELAGGSAANVAVALARLGRPVQFATAYGDDDRGRMLAARLADAGVTPAGDPVALPHTSTAVATIGPDGSATYEFDLAWRLNPRPDALPPGGVHVGTLGGVLAPAAPTVARLAERFARGALVVYDVNVRTAITGAGPQLVDRVARIVATSDLVKASDEDLTALFPDLSDMRAAKELLALGPAAVVVTRGGAGATWVSAAQEVDVAAVPVAVADTIGAGDTFCAAMIDALWELGLAGSSAHDALGDLSRDDVVSVLAHAARAAAITVSRPGADPPTRAELG
jgi:fructokinase